jgi:hypothetical protein
LDTVIEPHGGGRAHASAFFHAKARDRAPTFAVTDKARERHCCHEHVNAAREKPAPACIPAMSRP